MPFVPSQIVVDDADPVVLAEIVAGNPRGLLLWRDGPGAWIGGEAEDDADRATWLGGLGGARRHRDASAPARALGAAFSGQHRRDRAAAAAQGVAAERETGDDSLAARFLFAWPGPQPYRALAVSSARATRRSCSACARCRGWAGCRRSPRDRGRRPRARCARRRAGDAACRAPKAEGPEATWLGLSRSLIVRLAGVLELLGSIDGKVVRPGAIGDEQVEAAAALWRDYFWPHAKAVFDSAELSEHSKRVRRVARWLVEKRPATVSREEIRRRALSQAATADETQHVSNGCTISVSSSPMLPAATSPAGRRLLAGQSGAGCNVKTGSGIAEMSEMTLSVGALAPLLSDVEGSGPPQMERGPPGPPRPC